jgi:dTMP kinase
VFEGPDGSGKSTQFRRLSELAKAQGVKVFEVREPGGTEVGERIRQHIVLAKADEGLEMSVRCEMLLYMASRAELVEQMIRPALAAGKVVLVDRFFLSTYAYQIHGRGLDAGDVRAANHFATGGLVPDLTLLMRLPLAESLRRMEGRRTGQDRMERSSRDFHERVAAAFEEFAGQTWQAAHPECGKIVGIDATGSEAEVFGRLRAAITAAWRGSFPLRSA